MEQVYIVKVGGHVVDDEDLLGKLINVFAAFPAKKILVHGGGKLATRMAEQAGIPQQMLEGRRITDAATLKIVTMVYAGYINKTITAGLNAAGCLALGLTGADMGLLPAQKRPPKQGVDYGYVGDILPGIPVDRWRMLLDAGISAVVAPLTMDATGQLLNTNADTIAQELAQALAGNYEVQLIYAFEKAGVLMDVQDDNSVLPVIVKQEYSRLREQGIVSAGMVPKLDNAFAALDKGVARVTIGAAASLQDLLNGMGGTTMCHE